MDTIRAIGILNNVRNKYEHDVTYNYYICNDLRLEVENTGDGDVIDALIASIEVQLHGMNCLEDYLRLRHNKRLSGLQTGVLRKLWLTNMIAKLEAGLPLDSTLDELIKVYDGH